MGVLDFWLDGSVDSMYNGDQVTRVAAGAYSLATPDTIVRYLLDDVTNKIELYGEWCSLDVLSDDL